LTARLADITLEKCVFFRENPAQTPADHLLLKRDGMRVFLIEKQISQNSA
jgi:hypothetical protein